MTPEDTPQFRVATLADARAVTQLCGELDPTDYLPELFPEWVGRGDGSLMVAEVAGELVAIAGYKTVKPREAYLMSMRVSRHFQGHGIGRRLTAYVTDQALAAGYQALRLTTRRNNHAAQAMLGASGYLRLGEWDILDDWRFSAVVTDVAAELGSAGAVDVRRLNPSDSSWFWPWLRAVSKASSLAGVITQPGECFEVMSLEEADAREAVAGGQVWVAGAAAHQEGQGSAPEGMLAASAFALVQQVPNAWILRHFAGATEPCAALWRHLTAAASAAGITYFNVSLPGNQFALLRQAGLTGWEDAHWPGYIYAWAGGDGARVASGAAGASGNNPAGQGRNPTVQPE